MHLLSILATETTCSARTGTLSLPHGEVDTPVFMPVGTNATVKAISQDTLERMDVRLILGNTYHLYLRPGLEVIKRAGGLHALMDWDRNILTDSGGFQVFSLSGLRKVTDEGVRFQSHIDGSPHLFTPELVVEAQAAFGSDIAMPLDVCSPPGITHDQTKDALETTARWLFRSAARRRELRGQNHDYRGALFGIVQGGFFEDLRRESVSRTIEFELPGIAIGGLSVGESAAQFEDLVAGTAALLPADVPRYLMGIGTPDYILTAIEHGIDMFDCVLPTRTGRNGLVFSSHGPVNLKRSFNELDFSPIDETCDCTACRRYTRAYLRHLFKAKEIFGMMLATEHNIRFLQRLVESARGAIASGRFNAFKRDTLAAYQGGERGAG